MRLSVIDFPISDFLLTSFLSRSPIDMQVQPKYSAKASAFSFLWLPGGPTRKILLATYKDKYQRMDKMEVSNLNLCAYCLLLRASKSRSQEAALVY